MRPRSSRSPCRRPQPCASSGFFGRRDGGNNFGSVRFQLLDAARTVLFDSGVLPFVTTYKDLVVPVADVAGVRSVRFSGGDLSELSWSGGAPGARGCGAGRARRHRWSSRTARFFANGGLGVQNRTLDRVVAEYNYWGDDSGPADLSDDRVTGGLYNAAGIGEAVTDIVDYDPWIRVGPTIAGTVRAVSGDGQTGTAGSCLPGPVVVEVLSSLGSPLPGIEVIFSVIAGNATIAETQPLTTASDGRAEPPCVLQHGGTRPGCGDGARREQSARDLHAGRLGQWPVHVRAQRGTRHRRWLPRGL